jgi:hypothetical protein
VCGFAFGVLIDFFVFSEYVLGLMGYDHDGDGGMFDYDGDDGCGDGGVL